MSPTQASAEYAREHATEEVILQVVSPRTNRRSPLAIQLDRFHVQNGTAHGPLTIRAYYALNGQLATVEIDLRKAVAAAPLSHALAQA